MKSLKKIIVLVFILGTTLITAQNPARFLSTPVEFVGTSQFTGANSLVSSGKTGTPVLIEKTTSARLYLKLDFGDDYVSDGETFTVDINVDYNVNGNTLTQSMSISEIAPEQLAIIDLMPNVDANDLLADIGVSASVANITVPSGSLTENYITQKLKLTAYVDREYGIDVRLISGSTPNNIVVTNPAIAFRRASFSWTSLYSYPNYEIQILRLYNENLANNNPLAIQTKIDWTNALRVETQNYATSIDLTVAEGTGFYVWRVRPIGNYADGGIANQDNYGEWSTAPINGDVKDVDMFVSSTPNEYFHFIDPDEDINWIYNRVFSEGDENYGSRVSEGMSYADGLLRTRQSQAYNSDSNKTIVSQSVSDFSGRQALSTIPVPVNGGLNGYKASFVQNSNGDLYTAFDYDDTDIHNPSTVNDAGTAFDYYNGSQADGVGSTEGYSFSRTIFKTDGTGRPTESSGIGKKHALGTRVDGRGRTTRVIYGSPSDAELIRIFGDEAPLAESVIKTITIDPNDVVSVSYTSKEGKTIATALISDDTDNLLELNSDDHSFEVVNTTDQNVMSFNHFTSSKRIALWEDKSVELEYNVNSFGAIPSGSCPSGECAFEVKFYLYDLQNNKAYVSDMDGYSGAGNTIVPFTIVSGNLSFPATWEWVLLDNSGTTGAPTIVTSTPYNSFPLSEGEYLFMKKVYSANTGSNFVNTLVNQSSDALEPILDAIAAKMTAVNNDDDLSGFDTFLTNLSAELALHESGNDRSTEINILLETTLPITIPFDFELTNNSQGDPGDEFGAMTISTGCCGSMDIPIPKPDRCLVCEAVNGVDGATYDGIDLVRDIATTAQLDYNNGTPGTAWSSINALVQTEFIDYLLDEFVSEGFLDEVTVLNSTLVQEQVDRVAPGFSIATLGYMITNMLTSKYYIGQSLESGGTWYRAAEKPTGELEYIDLNGDFSVIASVEVGYTTDLEFNYDCKELYQCWTSAVNMIGAFEFDGGTNVMDAYNDDQGEDSSEDHYDDDESQDGSGGSNGLLDFIISWKMRKFNNSDDGLLPESRLEALVSLPMNFMNCVGYQFAEILDEDIDVTSFDYDFTTPVVPGLVPDPLMLTNPSDVSNGSILGHGVTAAVLIEDLSINPMVPELISCDDFGCSTTSTHVTLNYSYMIKPEWMFKYFAYNSYDAFKATTNVLLDNSRLLINQMEIELSTCYNNPNVNCLNPDLAPCFGEKCNYFHRSWSSAQRLNFYKQISGGRKCPKVICAPLNEPEMETPVALTKTELVTLANAEIQTAYSICNNRTSEFMNAIVEELTGACYEIVECTSITSPPWEVSEANVLNMVDAVVASCSSQVELVELNVAGLQTPYGSSLDDGDAIPEDGEYPWAAIVGCNWINYITESCEQNSKQLIKLFPDCDQTILDQITIWDFDMNLPMIDVNNNSIFDRLEVNYTGGVDVSPANGIDDSFEVINTGGVDANSNGIDDLYDCLSNQTKDWETCPVAIDCIDCIPTSGSTYSNQTTVSSTP